jgi:hypothetical protein
MSEAENFEILGMTAETIGKDLLAALIDEIKQMPSVWQKTPESQQREIIDRLRSRVEYNVKQAVHLINSNGKVCVVADLESVTIKDEIKAVYKVSRGNPIDAMQELFESVNQPCMLVIANSEQYTGGMHEVQPDPDQAGIDFDGSVH